MTIVSTRGGKGGGGWGREEIKPWDNFYLDHNWRWLSVWACVVLGTSLAMLLWLLCRRLRLMGPNNVNVYGQH